MIFDVGNPKNHISAKVVLNHKLKSVPSVLTADSPLKQQKPPKRSRLGLNDGSCIRLRPEQPGYVRSCDSVEGRMDDGRKFRILSIIDEASRESLASPVAQRLRS